MALGFENYLLLSSSPPGFEYFPLKKSFDFGDKDNGDLSHGEKQLRDDLNGITKWHDAELIDDRTRKPNQRSPEDDGRISNWENTYSCDPGNCRCCLSAYRTKMKKKCVTFADDRGDSLAEVRVMQEPSDVPPLLNPEVLNHLDSVASNNASLDSDAKPLLLVNFAQPAADYLAFRKKLDVDFVSLENAVIRGNQIFGTIKVKNISFNKKVLVRCTFDSWESFRDFSAIYSSTCHASFDTFSFQIEVAPDATPEKLIQFAICFQADGTEYWDNNDGKNYEILHSQWSTGKGKHQNNTSQAVFAVGRQESWTDFSGWATDHSNPYW